jgi:prepilin-type N-terminal cleavage/methylation domain-containing protein
MMRRKNGGFTLIEIISVLLLMSIIAATVLGRGINTAQIDLAAQMDEIRNHFRYAQSMAMKNGDQIWGFRCIAGPPSEYFIFRLDVPIADPVNDPDTPANQVQLPGEDNVKIALGSAGITFGADTTIFFDKFGIPYTSYRDESTNAPLAAITDIDISTRKLRISPETGFIE